MPPQTTLVLGNVASIAGRLISFEKGLDITYIEHVNRNEGGLDRSNISFSPDVLEKLTDYCALDTLLIKTHGTNGPLVGTNERCGGTGYTGCTQCASGLACEYHSTGWSQCMDVSKL